MHPVKESKTGDSIGSYTKRKPGKQFTASGAKKTTRIASHNNLKSLNKLTRIRSVESVGSASNSDIERPGFYRTRSNIENNNLMSRQYPVKANSMTNLRIKKTRKQNIDLEPDNASIASVSENEKDAEKPYEEGGDQLQMHCATAQNGLKSDVHMVDSGEVTIGNNHSNDSQTIITNPSVTQINTSHINLGNDIKGSGQNRASNDATGTNDGLRMETPSEFSTDRIRTKLQNLKMQDPLSTAQDNVALEPKETNSLLKPNDADNISFKEVDNSLNMYRMNTLLSQSTGQERDLSQTSKNTGHAQDSNKNVNFQNEAERKPLTDFQPKGDLPYTAVKNDNEETPLKIRNYSSTHITPDSSKSGISAQTNQDSLIFQQSAFTLYNLNTQPSLKNLPDAQINPSNSVNQFNMNRTVSQQSLQRQESYLSFKATDNFPNRSQLSMMNQGSNSTINNKVVTENPDHSFSKIERPAVSKANSIGQNESRHPKQHGASNSTLQPSLLSQQAKEQQESKKSDQSDILNIDLSSYLSTQEPEIETRTQQKLWLQRENVATLNDSEEVNNQTSSHIVNQLSRFQYEKLSREFLHIRRNTNPMLESLQRTHEIPVSKRRLSIDTRALEAPGGVTSRSFGKSIKKNSASVSNHAKSITTRLNLNESKTEETTYMGNLESLNQMVSTLWKQNCVGFEEQKPIIKQPMNATSDDKGPSLSARYGYQPTGSNAALPSAFARGNHVTFGQKPQNGPFYSNNGHFGNMNGNSSQYQPTTRAQQQQEHHRLQQLYKQQQQQQQQQTNH